MFILLIFLSAPAITFQYVCRLSAAGNAVRNISITSHLVVNLITAISVARG